VLHRTIKPQVSLYIHPWTNFVSFGLPKVTQIVTALQQQGSLPRGSRD